MIYYTMKINCYYLHNTATLASLGEREEVSRQSNHFT